MSKITIKRGDTRVINIPYLDANGAALDLTGAKVYFTVNASSSPTDDTSAVIAKSTSSFASPTSGIATITLSNTDTQNITPGTYYYDAQVKDASGNVTTSKVDKFIIKADITRSVI